MNNNVLFPILGLIATVALIFGLNARQSKEGFVNVPRKVVLEPLAQTARGIATSSTFSQQRQNLQNMQVNAATNQAQLAMAKAQATLNQVSNSGFVSVANYQKNIQDRFSPMGYTPYIKYKLPPTDMQGITPMNPSPLQYGDMVKEEYNPMDKPVKASPEYLSSEELMPSSTMETIQTYQTDRLMYSNKKAANSYGGLDRIRGDPPVMPIVSTMSTGPDGTNKHWFVSRYANATNLTQGALAALGGLNNETAKETAQLVSSFSGTAPTYFAGSPITGVTSQTLGVGPHRESVMVTAFP
jgi:hypothetical protein